MSNHYGENHYGENEAGENICVAKVMELSVDWTEAQVAVNIGRNVSQILIEWAKSHSDEYDQPYYSIVMTPAIQGCLREYAMMEKLREKRFNDERFKKAQLTSWKTQRDRISNILNNELCCFDGAKMMSNALNKYCNQCIDLRNDNEINYQGFRNSKALAGFDNLVRFVNSAHSKYLHLEIREKKAKLEKERVEFLQHRLEMEFQKYAVNN
jgi:hypothetical protein